MITPRRLPQNPSWDEPTARWDGYDGLAGW
jgi:hypothetical protein